MLGKPGTMDTQHFGAVLLDDKFAVVNKEKAQA